MSPLFLQAALNGFAGSKNSMMAGSPFSDYTAAVVIDVILIFVLVATILVGGIVVLNLSMMSKRKEDRQGGRAPSDVGILKNTIWPDELELPAHLPAEDEGQGGEGIAASLSSPQPPSHNHQTKSDRDLESRKRQEFRKNQNSKPPEQAA